MFGFFLFISQKFPLQFLILLGVDADTALQRINSSDGDVRTALRRE